MIKAIIIDDEIQARNALKEDIKLLSLNIKIVGEAGFVDDAVKVIDELMPDLVFMDIQLNDGTGFQVLDKTTYKNQHTIFTTAYNQYAIKAFKVNALDYLLKPIDLEELKIAVAKVEQKKENSIGRITTLDVPIARKRVSFQTSDGISLYFIDEIINCSASGNYTIIHFMDKSKLTIAKTLKEVEELFMYEGFERVHQSHCINLAYLKKYINKDGGYVLMSNGTEIPVSQRKKTALTELLLRNT